MDQVFQVKNRRLHLSRMVEWQFKNLSASFEKLVGTSKRTVMVYSDLVESTVVGSGKFPLLRESAVIENRRWSKYHGTPASPKDQSPRESTGYCGSTDYHTPQITGHLTAWENHRDHWTQTAIKTKTPPWSRTQTEQRCEEGV